MAVKLLQVLVLGVIAAAAVHADVPVSWVRPPRVALQCQIPDADRIQTRRPPPPLRGERPRFKPYIWRVNGETSSFTGRTLEVEWQRGTDYSLYQCAVRHQGGFVLGYPLYPRFAYLEKPRVNPQVEEVATAWRGRAFNLTCLLETGAPAAVSWLKNGEPLPDDNRYQLEKNQLLISAVSDEDAGFYRCRATNSSGTGHGSIFLEVEAPPEVDGDLPIAPEPHVLVARGSQPRLENVAAAWRGQPFNLSCLVDSGPPANVTWLKDGVQLPDDTRYKPLNNQLLITDVRDADAGIYRCRATNTLINMTRTSQSYINLVVEDPPQDLAPSFLPFDYESDVVVPRGSRVVLPCPVTGNPKPQLIWEMTPPGGRTGELESTEEVLEMPAIGLDEAGVYVCRVVGSNLLTKTFNVTIATPVNITYGPVSRRAVRAATVRFNCTGSGSPHPRVSWYKDGQPLAEVGRISVMPSAEDKSVWQLLIRNVDTEDAGIYQCFVRNSVSVMSAWAVLNVTGSEATAAPSDLRCWPAGAKEVALRWTPPGTEVMAYTVTFTGPDKVSLPSQPVIHPEAFINVRKPLTPFIFQVQAYLRFNRTINGSKTTVSYVSSLSKSVQCQGQGVPIKLSKAGNDSILVSWREFSVKNSEVAQWILQYRAENSTEEHNVTLDGAVYNYTLKLNPMRPQQVRVLGTKTLPWLPQNLLMVPWTASDAAAHHLPPGEVPAVPEDVEVMQLHPKNFTVRWRFEEQPMMVYSFMVCTRKRNGNEKCAETYDKQLTVRGLQPSSEYEVKVQTRLPGQFLGGDYSAPIAVVTPPEGRVYFRNLTYKYVNESTVSVSWVSDPSDYIVRYTYDYELPMTQWNTVDANRNTAMLTDLDPTKEVKVIVESFDPIIQSSVLTVPAQIPDVQDLQYQYTRAGLRVSWQGPGPRVIRYSQNLTKPIPAWTMLTVSNNIVELKDLDPSLRTFVMVAAPGASSRSHSVLTILPRPPEDNYGLYMGIGITVSVLVLCALAVTSVCAWRKRKRRTPRRRAGTDVSDAAEEMRNIGDRLANGGGSKDVGEPLLNGHVHITENPTQSKTPNGKIRKAQRYSEVFDMARYDDADVTVETVIDADTSTSTAYHLLDTSRRPEYDVTPREANDSFSKLPDDNMNSEVTRGPGFELDNSKVLPTLQPNG